MVCPVTETGQASLDFESRYISPRKKISGLKRKNFERIKMKLIYGKLFGGGFHFLICRRSVHFYGRVRLVFSLV